jgi:hypothetical protein
MMEAMVGGFGGVLVWLWWGAVCEVEQSRESAPEL